MDLYLFDIVADELASKSPVRKFWHERTHPKDGSKPMSGSSGNKDLGSLRKLYRRYFEHIGEEERENPFRNSSKRPTARWCPM